jgi:peptidoglycan/LPS O-acetylase OafA/YrhL
MKYLYEELDIIFGFHRKNWLLIDSLAAILGGFFYWLNDQIDLYVWSPSGHYYTLIALIVCDFITGSMYAWKQGIYETRKVLRIVKKLLAYTILLTLSFQFSKGNDYLAWLPGAVFVPIVVILMISFIVNLSLLGYIDNKLARFLTSKIDLYKKDSVEREKERKDFEELQNEQAKELKDEFTRSNKKD